MSQEEFKICFEQWFEEIRNYIAYRCGDGELATDIVQDAYIKIWEKEMEFREHATKSLLYKMANELWISYYRKKTSEQKYALQFSFIEEKNTSESPMEFEELKAQYELALAQMSEKRRTVYLMSRMDQLTYAEISERLEISVKAVEKRMHLALQDLRKILQHER